MRRWFTGGALLTAVGIVLASGTPSSVAAASQLCGTRAGPPAVYDHVVLLVFENKHQDHIFTGANAPYLQSLAAQCGRGTNVHEQTAKPSLANYIALTAGNLGSPATITKFVGPRKAPQDSVSIFQLLGTNWREISEGMTRNCQMVGEGEYAVGHAPSLYFPAAATACTTQNVPMTNTPDLSARFTLLTPNLHNIMHEDNAPGTLTQAQRVRNGDTWAAGYLPKVFDSPEYLGGRTVVIITWDEGTAKRSDIPFIVISPYTPVGYRTAQYFDHYSTLKGMQQMLGLSPLLGHAADPGVVSISRKFGLSP